jgi:long-chain acyl-CoA synthetase
VTPDPPSSIAEVLDRALAADPDGEALVTRSRRLSYGELDREANRAARALLALGVRAGDRVAASLPNDADVVIAFHGAMRIGAVWVGVNRALAPPEKAHILADSGASILLGDSATAEQVRTSASLSGLARLVTVDVGEPGRVWREALATASEARPDTSIDPAAPAGLAYTSGTTGHPKAASAT